MRKDEFEKFYEKTIKKYALDFVKDNPLYTFDDNSQRIFEEYLNQKTVMRVLLDKNDKAQLLDRHKVCAAMTVAILKCRPIICDNIDDVNGTFKLSQASMINEQIAFYCSWSLLKAFLSSEKVYNELKIPNTTHNSDFGETYARSLFFANIQNSLCPELIANIYFLIEKYNDALYGEKC